MDFSCAKYISLLEALEGAGYSFQTFEEFMNNRSEKTVILRHDVDRRPANAMRFAQIEASMDIRASYHFRADEARKDPDMLVKTGELGHEVAYHYEDLSRISRKGRLNESILKNAWTAFRSNLAFLRQYYPVRVASMHGDPASLTDNRSLWQAFSYNGEGIVCEPYYDIDYSSVLYLTDTGRKWDNKKVNVRDRVTPGIGLTSGKPLSDCFTFKGTDDIIRAVKGGTLPHAVIINTHPQRWNDNIFEWITEMIMQKVKNPVKYVIVSYRRYLQGRLPLFKFFCLLY
ncbi:MAG: hypothetical protein LBV26_05785 [Bacteroidales bacterium]|jgi:hypothetical protein|nr:hypothetical protein [Bacteroidales bacterium]